MTKIHKRYFLLMELVIAMSLAVTILSTLSYFYYQINLINIEMDKDQNENFQKRFLENRLANIFPKTISPKDPDKDFHFFTSPDVGSLFKQGSPSLVFSFDNGVQLDKIMSYHVIGRIFLDRNGDLVLAKWPAEKRWNDTGTPPMSKEVLMDNVDELAFSFFITPDKRKTNTDNTLKASTIPSEQRGQWSSVWNKEYGDLPGIVKMEVTKKNNKGIEEKLKYVFPLPHTLIPITYGE